MINRQAAIKDLIKTHGSPLYIYDKQWLTKRAEQVLEAAKQTECLVRYAVKANPHPDIIKLFNDAGIRFDASSEYEVNSLLQSGIEADKISLSSQQPPKAMKKILESGVHFVATSLHQLDMVKESGWRGNLAVRINPGSGSGGNNRTTTGGIAASFGVWHEYIPDILNWETQSGCRIGRPA
jgi:diaminopimelate decarboxylase